jgi:hypothetical protein
VKRIGAAAPAGGRCSGGDRAAVREEERGGVRETQGVVLPLYRVEEEGEEAHKAVAASALRRPLMAAVGAWCAAVSGRRREGVRRRGSAAAP